MAYSASCNLGGIWLSLPHPVRFDALGPNLIFKYPFGSNFHLTLLSIYITLIGSFPFSVDYDQKIFGNGVKNLIGSQAIPRNLL